MEYNIRANLIKEFFGSAISIILVIGIVIGLGIYLDKQADFGATFGELSGEDVDMKSVGTTLMMIIIGGGIVFLLFTYLGVMNIKYVLIEDGLRIKQPQLLVISHTQNIKFDNIIRVYVNKTLNSQIMGGGDIVVELTGMKDKSISLKSIDDPDQVMQFIMRKMNEYKMQQQFQYQQGNNINMILNKF